MNNWTRFYFEKNTDNTDNKNSLSLAKSLALDLFFHSYNADSFIKKPLEEGQMATVLEDCLKASLRFLSLKEEEILKN